MIGGWFCFINLNFDLRRLYRRILGNALRAYLVELLMLLISMQSDSQLLSSINYMDKVISCVE